MQRLVVVALLLLFPACGGRIKTIQPNDPSLVSVERFAQVHGRLHPTVVEFLQPYFDIDLRVVKVDPYASGWSYKGVTIWVSTDTIKVAPGRLNAGPYGLSGATSNIDLARPHTMAIMAHEALHVQQWIRHPLRHAVQWMAGVINSWLHGSLYNHRLIAPEVEAIKFQREVRKDCEKRILELQVFQKLRPVPKE